MMLPKNPRLDPPNGGVNKPVLRRGVWGVLKMTPRLRGQDS